MNRNAAAVALLVTAVMVLSSLWAIPGSQGIPVSPLPLLPHQSAITIEKFTGLEMQNLSPAPGGGVRLDYGDRVWGGEFKVDPDDDHQDRPSVAAGQNGRLFAVWNDRRLGPSDQNIYGQLFDKRGNRIGGEIAVCTAQNTQDGPDIASDANGSFLVAWDDQRDQNADQIYVKLFDSDGKMLKADAPVSTGSSFKAHPALASRPGSGYVLVWRDDRDGISQIYCRLLDSSGKPVSTEFSVSASQDGQDNPDIASDSQGRFVVVWGSQNIGVQGIECQRFDSGGNKAGTPVTIATGNYPLNIPKVAFDSRGNFFTAWIDGRDDATNSLDIYAARFDPNGTAIGSQIAVVTDPKVQEQPTIAIDGRDNCLISWRDGQLTDDRVGYRLFGPQGEAIGDVQYLSANHVSRSPAVCADGGNNFIIAYHGYSNLANQIYCRAWLQPFKTQSLLVSEPYAPEKLVRWDTMSANFTLANPSSNSLAFELSTDGGATWSAVLDNGSLATAAGKALRVRAMLLTSDNLTSPVLRNMTLSYTWNTPPAVTAPADVKVKKGKEVTLASNGTDPDLQDALSLGYKWNQTSGKDLGLANLTGRNLTFKADKVGRFTFSVTASDGYTTSAPATVTVVVSDDKKDEAGIPLMAIIAVAIVMIIVVALLAVMMMRRKPTTVIQYQPPQPPPAPAQPPAGQYQPAPLGSATPMPQGSLGSATPMPQGSLGSATPMPQGSLGSATPMPQGIQPPSSAAPVPQAAPPVGPRPDPP